MHVRVHVRHNFSFFDKVVFTHGPFFHHFDRDVRGATPLAATNDTKLARAQLLVKHELGGVDFPFIYNFSIAVSTKSKDNLNRTCL